MKNIHVMPTKEPKQLTDLEIAIKLEEIKREEHKQTAVEWLGFELNMLLIGITDEQWDKAEKLFQQAKEMEKNQIGEAYEDGYSDSDNTFELNKEYFNVKFKN